jgi:hypothetical protein
LAQSAAFEGDPGDPARRRARLQHIAQRLDELPFRDPFPFLVDLTSFQVARLAELHPPEQRTERDLQLIRQNNPTATPDVILERSMSFEGVIMMLTLARLGSEIALDYHPDSKVQEFLAQDDGPSAKVAARKLTGMLTSVFQRAVDDGLSPYGAAALMNLVGTSEALQSKVHRLAVAKQLIETLGYVIEGRPPFDTPVEARSVKDLLRADEDEIVGSLAQQLGVSRSTARRYAAEALRMDEEQAELRGAQLSEADVHWIELVIAHVSVGDFEDAMALVEQASTVAPLARLQFVLAADPRARRLDLGEIEDAIMLRKGELELANKRPTSRRRKRPLG